MYYCLSIGDTDAIFDPSTQMPPSPGVNAILPAAFPTRTLFVTLDFTRPNATFVAVNASAPQAAHSQAHREPLNA